MRGKSLISAIPLSKWLILFTSRDRGLAQDFKQTIQKVNPPMGISVGEPELYVSHWFLCVYRGIFLSSTFVIIDPGYTTLDSHHTELLFTLKGGALRFRAEWCHITKIISGLIAISCTGLSMGGGRSRKHFRESSWLPAQTFVFLCWRAT